MKILIAILLLSPVLLSASITSVFPGGRLLYTKEVLRDSEPSPLFYVPDGQFIRIMPVVHVRRKADTNLYAEHNVPVTGIYLYDFDLGPDVIANDANDVGAAHYIVGPCAVQLRPLSYLTDFQGLYIVEYYSTDPSTTSSATVHGINPVFEMSFDLNSWVEYNPSVIPPEVTGVFFRVSVEAAE